MNSSRNVEVEQMLDQPAEKRAGIRKEVFLKGRQNTLEDVVVLIANIIALGRFWVQVGGDDSPMILNILLDIADLLSSREFKSFYEKYKGSRKYMAHTLVVYIFNIFAVFVQSAKMPKVIRKFKVTNKIKFKHLRTARTVKENFWNN